MATTDKRTGLNERHLLFCHEYLKDFNASRAYSAIYTKASKKTAESSAADLLRNPKVKAYLAGRVAAVLKKSGYDADSVIDATVKRAFFDVKNFIDSYNECGVSFKKLEDIDGTMIDGIREKHGKDGDCWVEMDFPDRDKALDRIAGMLGLIKNKLDLTSNKQTISVIGVGVNTESL